MKKVSSYNIPCGLRKNPALSRTSSWIVVPVLTVSVNTKIRLWLSGNQVNNCTNVVEIFEDILGVAEDIFDAAEIFGDTFEVIFKLAVREPTTTAIA
jgi:hypothetical protein